MEKHPTFSELLEVQREGRNKVRPVVKAKPLNFPTDPEERKRIIHEAARRVIEQHREELERLAHK